MTTRTAATTLFIAALVSGVAHSGTPGRSRAADSPPGLSVPDLISLTRFGSRLAGGFGDDDAVYSPDNAHVAVVTQRGILKENVREFSLWLISTRASAPKPRVLASFKTHSNRPALSQVSWSSNHTLTFLAESPDNTSQVYTLETDKPTPTQLTHSALEIVSFGTSADGSTTAFITDEPPAQTTGFDGLRAHGFVVPPDFSVGDAMLGKWSRLAPHGQAERLIHVVRNGVEGAVPMPKESEFGDVLTAAAGYFLISPHGSYALLSAFPKKMPKEWAAYTYDFFVRVTTHGGLFSGWVVVDLRTGKTRSLTGGPSMGSTQDFSPIWTDDEHVLLVNELLPLADVTGSELQARASTRMTAELNVRSGELAMIEHQDHFILSRWDGASGTLTLQPMKRNGMPEDAGNGKTGAPIAFRKEGEEWKSVPAAPEARSAKIEIAEDLNLPWQLRLSGPAASKATTVLDPNHALLASRRLTRETEIHWTAPSGAGMSAGLYWPFNYEKGKRYPILLQTHDFEPKKFQPDGYSTTGYAAQPLAAAGMFVAQIDHCEKDCDTPKRKELKEGERIVEGFDSLLDYLDHEGLIDPKLVGMQGYSRSCYEQLFYLTHTAHPIAAMICADGVDLSYLQYLVFGPINGDFLKDPEYQNGGKPWGAGLKTWTERAPGFLLDRIHTPLRLVAMSDPMSLLEEWEPFAGLTLQGKPVELYYLPDTVHNIVKPWERFTSQQGTVDWFRFWLQGYERTEPVTEAEETSEQLKAQYVRWRELRILRDADVKRSDAQPPPNG